AVLCRYGNIFEFQHHFLTGGILERWWLPLLSLLTLVIAAALALQKPRPNTRAKIPWRGHPVTGQGATVLR
ncbi:MAG: hypothetical protein SNJ75_06530, partial [Gemmataceae bacterium]